MREEIQGLAQNFCVTAGAGAGKTTCLVETYLGLLAGSPGRPPLAPEQIVAITFTDKAAQEMRQRLVAAVAERARQGAPGPDWGQLLAQVEWAPIATIHSFCASLLREFGAVLDLDPGFAVLEANDFDELRQEVLAGLVRARLKAQDPTLARLLGAWRLAGRGGLYQRLAELQAGLATQGLSAAQARAATTQAHESQQAMAPELVAQLGALVASLAAAKASGEYGGKAAYLQKIDDLAVLWQDSANNLAQNSLDSAFLDKLDAILAGNWGKAKEPKDQAQELAAGLRGLAGLPAALALAQDLLDLAQELEAALDQELGRRAVLSFDHLLIRAQQLLDQHSQVLAELRGRYRALMVDEFQDVNPLQGRMAYLLGGLAQPAGLASGQQLPEGGPLVLLMGDRKQSIYAFRGADVSVFAQAMEAFAAGAGRVAALPENFRSRPELIAFFNRLFPQVFSQDRHREHAPAAYVDFGPHDQQVPGRQDQGGPPVLEVLDCRGLAAPEEKLSLAAWRRLEAQALAAHLRALVASGVQPGDIAVLFRQMTQVRLYEQALAQAGVGYYTLGGRGFYQTQEVGDLLQALRALLDPSDSLALAGLLRSPLVGLSDASLLCLAHPPGREGPLPLGPALLQGPDLPAWLGPDQVAAGQRARAWLTELLPQARRLSPAELLERLVEDSGLMPVLLGSPGGGQKAANLRKLIELARDPGLSRGGVEDFASRLAELAARDSDGEPQAPLMGEQAPVVRLLSIHKAKGLQFSVVMLADLAFKPQAGTPLLGPEGVLALKPRDLASGQTLDTTLTTAARARQKALEEAESARLFYVACTRARERLIFCLHGGAQGAWRNWVESLVLTYPEAQVVTAGPTPVTPPGQTLALAWPQGLPPEPGPLDRQGQALVERCLHPQPLPVARVSEPVSGLEDWLSCPRRYLFTRRLGLDTAWLASGAGGAGQGAAELGSAVHRLLELAPLPSGPAGLDQVLAGLDLEPGLAAQARDLAAGWWDTDLPARLAALGPGELSREQGFSLCLPADQGFPEVELIGEFDLLACSQDDQALVVDYKITRHVEPLDYQAQMALYCLALWEGQGRQGPLPQVVLCYLWPGGSQLVDMCFSARELAQWRERVRQAGRDIAALPPGVQPADLPAGPGCPGGACPLRRAGLCPGGEEGP